MPTPGTVVLCSFPGAERTKTRPSVVVSTDIYHTTRPDVIVGILTTRVADATGPTDYVLQDWAAAGLHQPSAFRSFLATLPASGIIRTIGRLSDRDWQEIQARLRVALAVT
jgi:mRNA interferase MazF